MPTETQIQSAKAVLMKYCDPKIYGMSAYEIVALILKAAEQASPSPNYDADAEGGEEL